MALNPPILAIPAQQADRDEHLHRFLTSLPRLGSNGSLRDTDMMMEQGERPQPGEGWEKEQGARIDADQDLEAERRLYERKIRRKEKAAILNPKPPPPPPAADIPPEEEPEELPDEWWDEFRRRKRGLIDETEGPRGSGKAQQASRNTSPKPQPQPKQRRIKSTGEGRGRKGKGTARGGRLGILANYQPSRAILASTRLTLPLRPTQAKAGIFANAKSSDPKLVQDLLGGRRETTKERSSASGPRRITLPSSSSDHGNEHERDWRDQWRAPQPLGRAPPSRYAVPSGLPPPGHTQSTSWPSPLQSDPPSIAGPSAWRNRYALPPDVEPQAPRPPATPYHPPRMPAYPPAQPQESFYPPPRAVFEPSAATYPQQMYADHFPTVPDQQAAACHLPTDRHTTLDHHQPDHAQLMSDELAMRDFWRRNTPSYPEAGPSHQTIGYEEYGIGQQFHPDPTAHERHVPTARAEADWVWTSQTERCHTPIPAQPQIYEQPAYYAEHAYQTQAVAPSSDYFPPPENPSHGHYPTDTPSYPYQHPPAPPSLSSSYRPSLPPISEHQQQHPADEMEQYGATTGEWKQHWKDRRAYR